MHELSLAMSIVDIACEEAEREGGRVRAVHLRIGAMVGVVADILHSSFEMAAHGTQVEGATLVIEKVPAMIHCQGCDGPRLIASLQWLACPDCGTPSAMVTQGREFEMTAMEIDE